MTMALDANQQRFATSPFGHMSSYPNHPNFTNPWGPSSSSSSPAPASASASASSAPPPTVGQAQAQAQAQYVASQDGSTLPHLDLSGRPAQPGARTSNGTPVPYGAVPTSAPYGQADLLPPRQDVLGLGGRMAAAASPVNATYATSPTPFDQLAYAQFSAAGARRYSQQSMASTVSSIHGQPHDDRRSFQDALEASHGMLSMSQVTPRDIYDVRDNQRVVAAAAAAASAAVVAVASHARAGSDGYGFPPTHSSSSSVSSSAGYGGGYYGGGGGSPHDGGGSVDGSVSDYSTAGSDLESLSGRTMVRPHHLLEAGGHGHGHGHGQQQQQPPPAPQSMMGSFNSKVTPITQKKHKCKVCDKRFTRPSSLQTHMYSHTGEKPFRCEVEGCGRHFSVVSNLRRHKKVHRGQSDCQAQTPSDAGSEDHQSE